MYNADKLTSIDLGRQGENLARTVEIDVSGMLAQWPDATITLLVKRKRDAEPYIVDTTVKDGVLFWPITAVETADAGDGKLEIRATCGEVIAKSATGSFRVTASLTGSGTEPPVTEQGWVEKVLAAGAGVEQNATLAAEAASRAETAAEDAGEGAAQVQAAVETATAKAAEAQTAQAGAESAKVSALEGASAAEAARASAEAAQIAAAEQASAAEGYARSAEVTAQEVQTKTEPLQVSVERVERDMQSTGKALLLQYSEELFTGTKVYAYKTSTFSGWISSWPMTREMFITSLKCAITRRGNTVTKVRIRIALDVCSDEAVVLDEMLEVDVPDSEERVIQCAVPMLRVSAGQMIYVAVEANEICSFAHVTAGEIFAYGYATHGNMDKSMDAYAAADGGRYRLWLVADGYALENPAMLCATYDPKARKTDVFAYAEYCSGSFERRFVKAHQGANLFDKGSMVVMGSWYYWATSEHGAGGSVALETNPYTGPYGAVAIPVTQAGDFTISMKNASLYGYWCVDGDSACLATYATSIGALLEDGYVISIPEGTEKVLLDIVNYPSSAAAGNELMAVYGNVPMEYEPYEWYLYFDGIRMDGGTLARIAALEASLGSRGNAVLLKLPERYELVVGDTFELFYKGIVDAVHSEVYDVEIECAKGACYGRRYLWTPGPSDAGIHPMTVRLYGINHVLLDERKIALDVKGKAAAPDSLRTVLYVGDSLAAGGHVPAEMKRRLTETGGAPVADGLSNLVFVGSCQDALAPFTSRATVDGRGPAITIKARRRSSCGLNAQGTTRQKQKTSTASMQTPTARSGSWRRLRARGSRSSGRVDRRRCQPTARCSGYPAERIRGISSLRRQNRRRAIRSGTRIRERWTLQSTPSEWESLPLITSTFCWAGTARAKRRTVIRRRFERSLAMCWPLTHNVRLCSWDSKFPHGTGLGRTTGRRGFTAGTMI